MVVLENSDCIQEEERELHVVLDVDGFEYEPPTQEYGNKKKNAAKGGKGKGDKTKAKPKGSVGEAEDGDHERDNRHGDRGRDRDRGGAYSFALRAAQRVVLLTSPLIL